MGMMGVCVDPAYGGLGLDYLSLAIAVEEISRGCASTGMIMSIHNFLYANLVNERGTENQKENFLRSFTRGSLGAFALSESGKSLFTRLWPPARMALSVLTCKVSLIPYCHR